MKRFLFITIFIFSTVTFCHAQNTFPSNGNVGIGTANPSSLLEISGITASFKFNNTTSEFSLTGSNNNGSYYPHFNMGLNGDNNYTLGLVSAFHDNMALYFDAYPGNGNWTSSHSGSNFSLYKYNNELIIGFKNNVPVGTGFLWNLTDGVKFSNDGKLGIGGSAGSAKLYVNGNVGIGTTNPDEKLTVYGNIHARGVKVDLNGALADYVFAKDYN